jgi:predicted dehydrogenase
MPAIRIALIGLGKIARDQHLPALARNAGFRLVATASPENRLDGVPSFADLDALLEALPDVEAVSICTPPQARYEIARRALEHGCHVMLEKPPATTVSDVAALSELARRQSLALFAAWHSREAPAVERARRWLANRAIRRVNITWREDARVWHPGQTWLWQPGGLGVFDPGINALSIATRILPGELLLREAEMDVPSNCAMPIAARLRLDLNGAPVLAEFDFRQSGSERWDIEVDTDAGSMLLSHGGSQLRAGAEPPYVAASSEYANLYAHFLQLVRGRRSDVDVAPLQLVADAFACAQRNSVEPFIP